MLLKSRVGTAFYEKHIEGGHVMKGDIRTSPTRVRSGRQRERTTKSKLQRDETGRADPERRYRKRYSKIEVRLGDKEIRFRIGTDRNGVRTGSDNRPVLHPSV